MPKYAIITGASRGIGSKTLVRLAQDGYDVIGTYVSDNSKEKLDAVLEEARSYNVRAEGFRCDIGVYDDCKKLIEYAISDFGTDLAVLVNNAGAAGIGYFLNATKESIDKDVRINMMGHIYLTHLVLPYMADNKAGNIVNISSVAGVMGTPTQVVYGACKAGLMGLSKGLSREVAKLNIRINCIAPGPINTDIIANAPKEDVDAAVGHVPLGRMGEPEEIAETVSFLVKNDYITGQTINVNGGMYGNS